MNKNILKHLCIILDGNKRWAKKNNFSIVEGYKKGFENIKKITEYSIKLNISDLTLFTLSSENFNRPSLNIIYELIKNNFSKNLDELISDGNVKVNIFGSRKNLPRYITDIFENIEKISFNNKGLNLNLAFNYGFKNEIRDVLKKYKHLNESINLENNNNIRNLFQLKSDTDPDILIRTGGYKRLSNFIMYNLVYTELFFTDTLWPDFSKAEFNSIINEYTKIKRTYGL